MNKVNMANPGPFTETFDFNTYGNEYMTANYPSTLTGSVVDVLFEA